MDLCVKNPTRSNRLTIRAQKPIYSIFGKTALQNLKWPGPSNMAWNWLVRRRQVLHLCTLTMDAKKSDRKGFGPNPTLRAIPLGMLSNMTEMVLSRSISRKWKMVRKWLLANRHDPMWLARWRIQYPRGTSPWYRTCSHGNELFTFSRKFYLRETRFWLYLGTEWIKSVPVFTTESEIRLNKWKLS